MPPLPRQHSAAIGCTKLYQLIEVTVHCIALSALKVSYSDVGEGGVAVNCEKSQLFLNTMYVNIWKFQSMGQKIYYIVVTLT